jgi:hypothetical protein
VHLPIHSRVPDFLFKSNTLLERNERIVSADADQDSAFDRLGIRFGGAGRKTL